MIGAIGWPISAQARDVAPGRVLIQSTMDETGPRDGEPQLIDVLHLGRPRVIGAWRVGDVLVD
ncbi:MAG: hypothetical protein QOI18_1901, partial [Solirubrobacteraceae bacterium]|nr:hypothetical protein [Solirubrobacteraceae bacterium]